MQALFFTLQHEHIKNPFTITNIKRIILLPISIDEPEYAFNITLIELSKRLETGDEEGA